MERKRRILFIGEASYIATGFGTYWQEVIKRLHATGEFEIAELGSYAYDGDPKNFQVPWKFYPVAPAHNDEAGNKAFSSKPTNQFGEWRFDDVCIEFKPDIVVGIRDWWMDEFALRSPLRNNFKFIWMPTIDGDPQKESWLDSYKQCDKVLTYSEWGMSLLKKQARTGTSLVTVASPGADLDVFSPPSDKAQHKSRLGIQPDTIIIGTVMRNQKRKLYYDLIQAFAGWLHKSKTKGHTRLASRTFLYLHTSYPDVGYDIGRAVREFEIGNKVIMTYLCAGCGMAFPAFFSGQTAHCRKCNQPKAHPPNASHHVPRHILADIMKTFDLYVQYSICWEKGSKVWMANGSLKPIEEVVVGDNVLTHDNKIQTVTETFESDPMYSTEISIFGDSKTYKCTDDHPILTKRGWIRAKNLLVPSQKPRVEGDWVGQPIPDLKNNKADSLDIDPYILGLLLGDGWIERTGKIGISLGYNKERAIAAINSYLLNTKHYSRDRNGGAIEFTWKDDYLVDKFKEYLGGGSRKKRFPSAIWQSTQSYVAEVLSGLFDADGHVSSKDIRLFTSSEILAYQSRMLLAGLNISSTINYKTRNRGGKISEEYCIIIKGEYSKTIWENLRNGVPPPDSPNSPRSVFLKIDNNIFWSKIKSIQPTEITDKVYNLEVENMEGGDAESSHSYVVGSVACHNCEGWG